MDTPHPETTKDCHRSPSLLGSLRHRRRHHPRRIDSRLQPICHEHQQMGRARDHCRNHHRQRTNLATDVLQELLVYIRLEVI